MPHKYDLASTVGVFALDVVLGGIIGGFALIFQIFGGVIETIEGLYNYAIFNNPLAYIYIYIYWS